MSGDDSSPAPSDPGGGPEPARFTHEHVRYERQGLLGLGGMGRVYAARDTRLRRQVALKVAATPELAGRLAREAWITAQLEHPGIVAVYDAGETDGQAWYTMRLIRGRTLRERLHTCPTLAARLALLPHLHAASQAVAYAHSMGIIHRDLKPSNIMVGEFGETQVADWGLARPIDEAVPDWQRIVSGDGRAEVAGTPRYMSPEQASGAPAGRASDVFCLGAALYELLTGQAPPERAGEPPDPETIPKEVPRELVAIVRRSLQVDPAERYPSAIELADDLGRWLAGRRVHAHEYQPLELLTRLVRAWRAPLAVGAIALLVLSVVLVYAVQRTRQERATAEANLAVALTQQALAALDGDRLPEARVLAAHALLLAPSAEARGVVAATSFGNAEPLSRVPLPESCRQTGIVSPDGGSLVCHAAGKLEIWTLDPLVLQASLDLHVVETPAWVGARLLVATPDELVWIEDGRAGATVPGAAWRPLASGNVAFATRGPDVRRLLPDGGMVEFETCLATRATTIVIDDMLVIGCDDGALRAYAADGAPVFTLPVADERPQWSVLAPSADGLLVGRFDGTVRELSLPGGEWGPPLRGLSRSVRALQPVPGTAVVLALGERGGPRLWNTEVGAWAGALPAGARRMYAGAAPGDVLLLGDTLDRWHIAATPHPGVFPFGTGVSQVSLSPEGDTLLVALGEGSVVERRISDGRELRRWWWTDGVAKCAAYGRDGVVVASAMGAPSQRLGPTNEVRPIERLGTLRRAGRLADGRVWTIAYGDLAHLVDPSTGTVIVQSIGPAPFDGSSSPDGGTAAILDNVGGIWVLDGSIWAETQRVTDAVAVDLGNGGAPMVVARQREVCVDERCTPITDDIVDVAYADGRVAVATFTGDVWLLDEETGETLAVLRGHTGRVSSVEFGPDGSWLVSGSWDGTVRIWDLSELGTPAEVLIDRSTQTWGLGLQEALRSL